jgi:hypothetical protein
MVSVVIIIAIVSMSQWFKSLNSSNVTMVAMERELLVVKIRKIIYSSQRATEISEIHREIDLCGSL